MAKPHGESKHEIPDDNEKEAKGKKLKIKIKIKKMTICRMNGGVAVANQHHNSQGLNWTKRMHAGELPCSPSFFSHPSPAVAAAPSSSSSPVKSNMSGFANTPHAGGHAK